MGVCGGSDRVGGTYLTAVIDKLAFWRLIACIGGISVMSSVNAVSSTESWPDKLLRPGPEMHSLRHSA